MILKTLLKNTSQPFLGLEIQAFANLVAAWTSLSIYHNKILELTILALKQMLSSSGNIDVKQVCKIVTMYLKFRWSFVTDGVLKSPWSNMDFLLPLCESTLKTDLCVWNSLITPTGFISPQKTQRLLTTLTLYIPGQTVCKYQCACMHVCVSVHSGSFICILSQAGRQAGFWQGPELWNGLSLQFCRWLDQPIPLYLAEGSPNPTAAVPFCEILFNFTTLTDKKACTHACASPRPHATFV